MKPAKALANAAAGGDLDAMRAQLRADGSLASEWQPLMDACYAGQAGAVALLLEAGADPNIKSKSSHHYRPLHRTVEFKKTAPKHDGHHEVVRLLLDAGADPLQHGSYWLISAVALSATTGATEFLPALLESAPEELDILHACVLGDEARVRALLAGDPALAAAPDPDTRIWTSDAGWTPLLFCSRTRIAAGDATREQQLANIAKLLIEHGCSLQGCVDNAVFSNNAAVLEVLVAAGAQVSDDDTLNHAACDGQYDALEVLLASGVPLDGTRGTEHHGGYTPLGCAVASRSVTGARWFLEHGQSANDIKSDAGENCLHVAVANGASDKMLQLLLEHGAERDQRDAEGRTPLTLARERKRAKAVQFLESAGASG